MTNEAATNNINPLNSPEQAESAITRSPETLNISNQINNATLNVLEQ